MRKLTRAHAALLAVFALTLLLSGPLSRAGADEEPAAVRKAKDLIKTNAQIIAFFALPTYDYKGIGHNDTRALDDGYELTYTFEVDSAVRSNTMRLAFIFDREGKFDFLKVVRHTSYWTPFTDAVGTTELKAQRKFMAAQDKVKDSRKVLQFVEEANAKQMCELYLKLEQQR